LIILSCIIFIIVISFLILQPRIYRRIPPLLTAVSPPLQLLFIIDSGRYLFLRYITYIERIPREPQAILTFFNNLEE
ncbi:MAG: hypothetical protein ACJ706_05570, partial [Nitrososphaeraceae archaeon]